MRVLAYLTVPPLLLKALDKLFLKVADARNLWRKVHGGRTTERREVAGRGRRLTQC